MAAAGCPIGRIMGWAPMNAGAGCGAGFAAPTLIATLTGLSAGQPPTAFVLPQHPNIEVDMTDRIYNSVGCCTCYSSKMLPSRKSCLGLMPPRSIERCCAWAAIA